MKNHSLGFINIAFIILLLTTVSGCSNKELYQSMQPKHDVHECRNLPPHQYDECMKHETKSYEEYKKEREEVINQQ